jgi:glycosyltransferase involved in cell wall biosynthesis
LPSEPLVSIITACRNVAGTIEDTILGVLSQGYPNIEYIIVDAESDDGTADVIRKYEHDVALWIRGPDGGIADAWNKGIGRASGEIVGIINGDDFYAPDALKTIGAFFARRDDVGFVYGDLKHIDGSGGCDYVEKGRPDYERILLRDMLNIPHPTVFVRREIYRQLGAFNSRYKVAPDYEFLRRIVSKGVKGEYIPQILAVMRGGGVSETKRLLALREVRTISVAYGYNRALASCYFYVKRLRLIVGGILRNLGISAIKYREVSRALGIPGSGT